MAEKNILMQKKKANGTFDIYYPKTTLENVEGLRSENVYIGKSASAAYQGVAIGRGANAAYQGMAIGLYAETDQDGIAIGYNSFAYGLGSIAIGEFATAESAGLSYPSIAIGYNTTTSANYALAFGVGADALNYGDGVLGGEEGPGVTANWIIPGNLSVEGSKNFCISHPHPDKKDTHDLRHACVESPNAQNLYRFEVVAQEQNEVIQVQLPDYFPYLNSGTQVWVSSANHFGRGFGTVNDDVLTINCESPGSYNVLVVGTRSDDRAYNGSEVKEKGLRWDGTTEAFSVTEIMEITEIEEVA